MPVLVFTDGGVRPNERGAAAAWVVVAVVAGQACLAGEGAVYTNYVSASSSFVAETIAIDYAMAVVAGLKAIPASLLQLSKHKIAYRDAKVEDVKKRKS